MFHSDGAFEANPVVWRVLAKRAIAARGEAPSSEDVWFDADALRRWNLANLDSYWSDWVQWAGTKEGTEERVRSEYGLQWLVLGVPRLHYTIATLDVTSKSGAGRYALEVAPAEWRAVLDTTLALRVDRNAPLPATTDSLWRDAIELSAWFIADAHRLADAVSRSKLSMSDVQLICQMSLSACRTSSCAVAAASGSLILRYDEASCCGHSAATRTLSTREWSRSSCSLVSSPSRAWRACPRVG